jgi:uncharacterized protein YcbK (DUF882 family)
MYIKGHFKRSEFSCKCGCGFSSMDAELLEVLEDVRAHFNSPIKINSGCRCQKHNKEIGGAETSMHTKGMACDFVVLNLNNQDPVADYLENKYQDKYGIGRYVGRTHVDVREGKARWDNR